MENFLIVGLGNIGNEYDNTRHNIGFEIVHEFAKKHHADFKLSTHAFVAKIKLRGRNITILKPTTYMNLSGDAFIYWQKKENILLENCLVLVDDFMIPLSKLKLKMNGSHGGHNGLKHIEKTMQTNHYKRLRFGIGDDFIKKNQVDFVLGKWTEAEKNIVDKKINYCCEAIEKFIYMPFMNLMNDVNAIQF